MKVGAQKWVIQIGVTVEIVAGVVEGHDDHYDAPEKVDGFYPARLSARCPGGWFLSGWFFDGFFSGFFDGGLTAGW
jgi:hypothetical protein